MALTPKEGIPVLSPLFPLKWFPRLPASGFRLFSVTLGYSYLLENKIKLHYTKYLSFHKWIIWKKAVYVFFYFALISCVFMVLPKKSLPILLLALWKDTDSCLPCVWMQCFIWKPKMASNFSHLNTPDSPYHIWIKGINYHACILMIMLIGRINMDANQWMNVYGIVVKKIQWIITLQQRKNDVLSFVKNSKVTG